MINQFIMKAAEKGWSQMIQIVFLILAAVVFLILNVSRAEKCGVTKGKASLFTLTIYLFLYGFLALVGSAETGFKFFTFTNVVKAYIWMLPLSLVMAPLFKADVRDLCDLIGPGAALNFAISHIGCAIFGCCHGYPSSWGIYNPFYKTVCFPTQLIESILNLLIFIFLIAKSDKLRTQRKGQLYPLFLMMYGFQRFFMEFYRMNAKLIGPVSDLALHALSMVLVGFLWYRYVRKHEKSFALTRS